MKLIFDEIKNAFSSLWKCRPRGNSIEIITPFATATNKYISVFLTLRDGAWIASDGGWIVNGMYDIVIPFTERYHERYFKYFIDNLDIKRTESHINRNIVFYKGTYNRKLVPNIVFDVATFISQTVSTAASQIKERISYERFSTQVKDFLKSKIDKDLLKFNSALSDNPEEASYGVIVSAPHGLFSVINYATGNNSDRLNDNIAKASFNLDFAKFTEDKDKVEKKIVLINDETVSTNNLKVAKSIKLCRDKDQYPICWSNGKSQLISLLNIRA